ncbi:MAG: carboxypeptidase regulatory-like domain-containing protein, partial [Ginsengibacter sp.]
MYKIFILVLVCITCSLPIYAQSVSGIIMDSVEKVPLSNASISLAPLEPSSGPFSSVADRNGAFSFKGVADGNYTLTISSVGYEIYTILITAGPGNTDVGNILVSKAAKTLTGVIVNGAAPPVRQRQDTVEYAASQYKVNPDANAEDLIKKMPGVTVDQKGSVSAQGETVRKVTVDGRDFFGDDATATLRNLPSEVVDKIQVFDKLSDQAQLTGFDDGNTTKSINIVTKKDMRNGNFGRVYAGYGTNDRYSAGGNVSFFNNARRISLVGLVNNINQQNFASQD